MKSSSLFLSLFLTANASVIPTPAAADDLPELADVERSMKRAIDFFCTELAVEGGYASAWSLDSLEGHSEHRSSPTVISIQPPGVTTVGLTMLHAYEATGENAFLTGARNAASALIQCQLSSGGWASDFDFDPDYARKYHLRKDVESGDTDPGKRRRLSTLDDNKTQSALIFLQELASIPESKDDSALQSALRFGMNSLLAAQAPNGSWPQQFDSPANPEAPILPARYPETWSREWTKPQYHRYPTLNDGNLTQVMKLLLRASDLTGNPDYLASARRLGEFLLRAQMPKPQRGWAQQYNENMEPAWARKFEPPSLSSVESYGAIEALFSLWLATGEDRFRATIPAALDWLASSELPDGQWARFYELKTNRPLYCEAETYLVTYDDSNLPTHYGFQIDSGFGRKIERMRQSLVKPREDHLRSRREPETDKEWEKRARGLRGKVRDALKSQEAKGYWIKNDLIDAALFSKNVEVLAAYVRARRATSSPSTR